MIDVIDNFERIPLPCLVLTEVEWILKVRKSLHPTKQYPFLTQKLMLLKKGSVLVNF